MVVARSFLVLPLLRHLCAPDATEEAGALVFNSWSVEPSLSLIAHDAQRAKYEPEVTYGRGRRSVQRSFVELAQAWPNYSCEKLRDFINSKLPTVSYQPSNLLGLYLLLDVVYVWTLLHTAQLTAGEL